MKEKLVLALFALVICSMSIVFAQETSGTSVILTTAENYPDALVAASASVKIGAPILVVSSEGLTDELKNEIASLQPETIYIIGGPEAISDDVETELVDLGYNVVRIWGATRFGTAAEVAKYFWPEGSEVAVLACDNLKAPEDAFEIVTAARNLASLYEAPLLLIKESEVPAVTLETLEELGVTKVKVVCEKVSEAVQSDLNSANITVEVIEGNKDTIEEEVEEDINKAAKISKTKRPLIVVAAANFTGAAAPTLPSRYASVLIVTSEEEILSIVEKVKEANASRVFVTGKPDLAKKIYDALEEANITATLVSGRKVRIAIELVKRYREDWKHKWKIKGFIKALRNATEVANRTIERAEDYIALAEALIGKAKELGMNTALPEKALEFAKRNLEKAKEEYTQREYGKAIRDATRAIMLSRKAVFLLYKQKEIPVFASEFRGELRSVGQITMEVESLAAKIKKPQKPLEILCKRLVNGAREAMKEGDREKAIKLMRKAQVVCREALKSKKRQLPKEWRKLEERSRNVGREIAVAAIKRTELELRRAKKALELAEEWSGQDLSIAERNLERAREHLELAKSAVKRGDYREARVHIMEARRLVRMVMAGKFVAELPEPAACRVKCVQECVKACGAAEETCMSNCMPSCVVECTPAPGPGPGEWSSGNETGGTPAPGGGTPGENSTECPTCH